LAENSLGFAFLPRWLAVPADKGLNSRPLVEGCNGKTGTSSGIPAHSTSITATTSQRTATGNLEQPNYEGKCDNKYDRNLDKPFHFFSPLQEFVTNQELYIFCYDITTEGGLLCYTYFYVYFQSSGISLIRFILADSSPPFFRFSMMGRGEM
jgi:hypothetical protein